MRFIHDAQISTFMDILAVMPVSQHYYHMMTSAAGNGGHKCKRIAARDWKINY